LVLIVSLVHCSPALSAAHGELVTNGLLSQGRDGEPVGWRHSACGSGPEAVKFSWELSAAGVGVLKITNLQLNDSLWAQRFAVSPSTWYRVSGWVRTQNAVPTIGAHLTVEHGFGSTDLRKTSDWQLLEFWMKTKPDQKSEELQCRLGGSSALSTGTAYFTAISFSEGKPPPWALPEQVHGATFWDFREKPRVIEALLTLILAPLLLRLLWRFVLPASSRVPQ